MSRAELSPLILAVDTATLAGGVCVARAEEILADVAGDAATSHSNTLLRDIDQALHLAGVLLPDIDLFAAASGPGSFTGLRIGLASIKALAATLERPCVGIPTLHAVALAGGPSGATVALLPAGRGEVFAQLLSVSQSGDVKELDQPAHLPPSVVLEKYREQRVLLWAGEGTHIHRSLIQESALSKGLAFREQGPAIEGWTIASREENLAKSIAALAWQRFERGSVAGPESLQANYVRPSDAELKH